MIRTEAGKITGAEGLVCGRDEAYRVGMDTRNGRNRLLRALFVLFALLAAMPAVAQTLRVMSFNVRLMPADDGENRWDARRELLVDTIRRARPDVMGTQELFKEQGDAIVAGLPQYAWFGRGRRGDDGDEHMGVFYRKDRLRVVESGDFWLSDTPEVAGSITWGHPFPRMVTWALFERMADGRRFYFFDTHLPYREEDGAARARGAALIAQRIATLPEGVPVVVTGDFNDVPGSDAYRTLAATLQDAWTAAPRRSGPEATFHNFTGKADKRIDWIWSKGLRARRVQTITDHRNGHYPSDHFPVLADYRWPSP